MKWLTFISTPPSVPKGMEKKKERPKNGVYYDASWARSPLPRLARDIGIWTFKKPAITLYGSPKVVGADRLQNIKDPVIFVSNHQSHADTTLLLSTIPAHMRRKVTVAAGADYFFTNRLTSFLSTLFIGAIPIERNKLSKLSIRNALDAIEDGNSLLIFPEGGRSVDGWNSEHKPGAAFIAKLTGLPIVPIYISGTDKVLPKDKKWPVKSRCAVVFGSPMSMQEEEDPRLFAGRVQEKIDQLADEFTVGWWESRKRAHAKTTPSMMGPDASDWRRRWKMSEKPKQIRPSKSSWPFN